MNRIFLLKNNKGQGLLELTISLSVITVGLLAIFSLINFNLTAVRNSQSNMVATNLSREGIEVVRNIRDSNWLAIQSGAKSLDEWDDGLQRPGGANDYTSIAVLDTLNGVWSLDWQPNNINSCRNNTQCRVYFNDNQNNKLFRQAIGGVVGSTPRDIYRLIQTNPICDVAGVETIITDADNKDCGDISGVKIGIQVISEVQWIEKGTVKNFVMEDKLYNWK